MLNVNALVDASHNSFMRRDHEIPVQQGRKAGRRPLSLR
jgi:hypothetical protein